MDVKINTVVFWAMISQSLVRGTNVSEEHNSSVLMIEIYPKMEAVRSSGNHIPDYTVLQPKGHTTYDI
jgi:hypothetical protein